MPTHQGGPITMTMLYQSITGGSSPSATPVSFDNATLRAITQTAYSTNLSLSTASRAARIVVADGVPTFGPQGVGEAGSAYGSWPPTNPSGWPTQGTITMTSLLDSTPTGVDDSYVTVPLPFTFYLGGTGYTTAYVGTNSYITFGGAAITYSGLGPTNPPYNKIMIGSADRTCRRIGYYSISGATQTTSDTNFYVTIRYEGYANADGDSIASTVWECTLWNPSSFGGLSMIELRMGNIPGSWPSSGYSGIATTNSTYRTFTPTANQSIVFFGSSNGTYWTDNTNSYPFNNAYFTGVYPNYYVPKTFY